MSTSASALKQPVPAQEPRLESGSLFSPFRLGSLELANRIVMSPMTRSRALEGNVPNPSPPRTTRSALPRA
jgi:2,4-dienoyl-CoA reductase-like NADH-dependent reductase (Old Yellow Enzyme family)